MSKCVLLLFAVLFYHRIHAQIINGTNPDSRPAALPLPQPIPLTPPRPTTAIPAPPDFKKKPPRSEWPLTYSSNRRHIYADYLLNGNWSPNSQPPVENPGRGEYEYEGYDGWYNNLARPDSGAIDRPLLRRWPAAYEDGTYLPSGSDRPNPFELSERLLSGGIGTSSVSGRNALLVFFGQQVVEEILDAQRAACPPEYFNIKIPEDHRYHLMLPNHTEMPLLRSRYDQSTGYSPNNPRQQLNEITPYIDGGLFYGITKQWSDQLRTYQNGSIDENGCLATTPDGLFPEYNTDRLPMANPPPPFYHGHYTNIHETAKVNRFFKLGNPRGNENAYLLTFGIMWFRWHNYLAKRLKHHHPDWNSEKIFNEARKWTIATQQKIYVYEWLPTWINRNLPPYLGYDPGLDPQIDQFFQTTAFRFGHTLVVPGIYLRDYIRNGCKIGEPGTTWRTIRTCNIFWRGQEPLLNKTVDNVNVNDIDRMLMGMSVMLSEKEDHEIVEDLRGNVFGPLEFPRRDLMAVNIQRARDHGMPDFNSARRAFGLEPYTVFTNFTHINETIRASLMELYGGDINKIDPWIGGILETDPNLGTPGPLFRAVISDQFRRIRDADRFWFENPTNNLFTPEEIERINSTSIYDVIMAVTKMDPEDIPSFPFRAAVQPQDNNLILRCNLREKSNKFFALDQLNQDNLAEPCRQGNSYDYFRNSEVSYILTFAGLVAFTIGTAGFVYMIIRMKEKKAALDTHVANEFTRRTLRESQKVRYPMFIVNEYIGPKESLRKVVIILNADKNSIFVQTYSGTLLRAIDFSNQVNFVIQIYTIYDEPTVVLKCRHNYDLVMKFESEYLRENFMKDFDVFITAKQIMKKELIKNFNWKAALRVIVTKSERQQLLEMFFRVTFAQAFQIQHSKSEMLKVDKFVAKEIVDTELTISEFADSLSMKPDNEFVNRMFTLIDKDKNGFISYREFVDLLIIFANGTEEQKAKLLFDMYDIDGTGNLKSDDFIAMIRSFLETVGGKVEEKDIQQTINVMLKSAGVDHKTNLNFEDFKKIIGDDIKNLNNARLGFKGVKSNPNDYLSTAKDTIENIYESKQEIETRFKGLGSMPQDQDQNDASKIIDDTQEEIIKRQNENFKSNWRTALFRFIELHSKEIFWYSLYTMVMIAIFAERAYYYSVEREHSGLRRIAGHGVTITRGAASAMMFTYSSLFVTMSRNTITYLRDTVANRFFPFDASVEIHKYIAYWALVFTVIHMIGHAFNFYHISTQTSEDLTCLFRNYFRQTHVLPKFHYWCWETMTGFTGIVLVIIVAIMYTFAQSIVRRKIYNWFWYTHNLYPIFFIFFVLHGTGQLIQRPLTYYFLLGPVVLFAIDSLISISRKKIEIPVTKAEILPSSVTMLQFRKPENFNYKAGQWVRIACIELNKSEYHPFTLSSAPDEDQLTVHIRSVGPWTNNIRSVYDSVSRIDKYLPKIYLDGPYGEGHQDWNSYDVAILIGGGIGVTPFASILKDVAFKANRARTHCQKVYFIWVSRTQKQFEWLVDIIREVESKDHKNFVSCHIFITQFYEKFDLRTILLYICERHYQRVSNKSLFTNLRAVTHFGRPAFPQFFKTVQSIHSNAKRVGVFSCGPPSMTSACDRACGQINRHSVQRFEHHFKNF